MPVSSRPRRVGASRAATVAPPPARSVRGRAARLGMFATAAALLVPASATAYCRTSACPNSVAGAVCTPPAGTDCGTPLFWGKPCLGFSVQQDASTQVTWADADRIASASFNTWLTADCGGGATPAFRAADLGPVVCTNREYNQDGGNANLIVFRDASWPYTNQWNTLALTTVSYNLDTGEIYDADVEINSSDTTLTTGDTNVQFDLQSILTHELGHVLGLAHSKLSDATMAKLYQMGDTSLRELAADDIKGICAIYPPVQAGSPGDPAACDPSPRRGLQSECGAFPPTDSGGCSVPKERPGSGVPSAVPLGLLGLLWGVRRRWR